MLRPANFIVLLTFTITLGARVKKEDAPKLHVMDQDSGSISPYEGNNLQKRMQRLNATRMCDWYSTSTAPDQSTPQSTTSAPSECKEEHYGDYGYLATPNYPDCYPNRARCDWSLQAPSGQIVGIEFLDPFGLESGFDFVEIRDGAYSTSPLIGRFTGWNNPGILVSTGNSMYVSFSSDEIIPDVGFKISYQYVSVLTSSAGTIQPESTTGIYETSTHDPRLECIFEQYPGHGIIASPNYPDYYHNNALCEWTVTALRGYIVLVEFISPFALESGYDFVEVRDGPNSNSPLLGRYTGSQIPNPLFSSNNNIYLRFTSDQSGTNVGFKIAYEFITIPSTPEATSTEEPLSTTEKQSSTAVYVTTTEEPAITTPYPSPTPEQTTYPPPFCPPSGVHTYPYPGNCTLYIKCFDGTEQVLSCAPLIFDKIDLVCKPEGEAVCDEEFPVKCPPLGYEAIPHTSSCSKYYECLNGNAYESECVVNTYFDATPDLLRCNQAELALCNSECPETGIAFQVIRSSGCKWYKICIDGHSANLECAAGEVYSPMELKCVAEGSYICPYA